MGLDVIGGPGGAGVTESVIGASIVPASPSGILPGAVHAPSAFRAQALPWFVLHTKPRQEKALAACLEAVGTLHYVPFTHVLRFYGRRQATVDLPLFPGYVFLRGIQEQAWMADRTRRVVSIIAVGDHDRLTRELRTIDIALSGGATLDPHPYLRLGIQAEVRSGPLRGLQGVIESRSKPGRLILQVEMLGRAVSVDLPGALLEPL
jgi:transcription antitermination factor NusG